MKFKLALLSFFMLAVFSPLALAEGGCPLKGDCRHCASGGRDGEKGDCGGPGECPIAGAFKKKAHFFLDNAEEIGLSEQQVQTIKQLKKQVKIGEIQAGASMQVGMIEMESLLHANPVDVEALNAMIDKGMGEMAAGAKQTVSLYAQLKAVLTPDQMTKAKALWSKNKDEKPHH